MNHHCYYVAADHRGGPRPSVPIEHSTRVYRSEARARQAAQIAEENNRSHRFDVGSLTDIPTGPPRSRSSTTRILHPDAVPDDDADIYAMRSGRHPVRHAAEERERGPVATRVPRELAAASRTIRSRDGPSASSSPAAG